MATNQTDHIKALVFAAAQRGGAQIADVQARIDQQNAINRADELQRAITTLHKRGTPDWAIEYIQPLNNSIRIDLPGCSQLHLAYDDYSPHTSWEAAEPTGVEYVSGKWHVALTWSRPPIDTFEAALSMADTWGIKYHNMVDEATYKNIHDSHAIQDDADHATPPQPSRLDRICTALETIAAAAEREDKRQAAYYDMQEARGDNSQEDGPEF